jgi:hypothetical protein
MKAKDLRQGNFWDTGGFYGIDKVESYNIYQLSLMEKGSTVADFYHHVKPIPLTEDWLFRFGFEKHGEWYIKRSLYHEDISISLKHQKTTFGCNEEYEIKNIEFVHTLQNIYHSFTGEELTLTTPAL